MEEQDKELTIEEAEQKRVDERDQDHEFGKERFKIVGLDLLSFLKNLVASIVLGAGVGLYASAFAIFINLITAFRMNHDWLIFLLPVGGLMIVGFYHLLKAYDTKGTNRVLESISSNEELPLKVAILITVGTSITHLFGGSAGREGAALQIGGSIGRWFGNILKFSKRDITVMTLCGMSAAFAAMFGTPLTATVFAMEVISIGIIHYSAIVPCGIAALTATMIAKVIGYVPENYPSIVFPQFDWLVGVKAIGMGVVCAIVSVAFCITLHKIEHLYKRFFPNPYLRTVVGGALVVLITILIGTRDYNGAGVMVIFSALKGDTQWYSFIMKIILTALTLGACYKGGEIIPTIFIGATFGCFFAPLIGISAPVGAAIGICGVFCGVTNCPLASIALSFELFGLSGLPMFLIVAAVSYRLSGYYGIYTGQKIMYSKSRPLFINRTTWK